MCDSVVATGQHTQSGLTLFGKNSDRKAGECQPFVQFAAARHPPGAELRCTHLSIAQVPETYRVMGHSPWWVWGFEHGVNEYGLAIGNQAVFSRQVVEEAAGLIGMDLVRLALERCRDRNEALACITSLLETHGQGGAGFAPDGAGYHNSFNIADPDGAIFLETSGRHWAMREIELDGLSNHICTGSDWDRCSKGLESFARSEGFWSEEGPVHLERALRHPQIPARLSDGRLARSRELLERSNGSLDVARIQNLLRDHGEGLTAPPSNATLEDDDFFTICVHNDPPGPTTASMVTLLPKDLARPWPVWVSFAVPCSGVFLPVYLDGVLPAAMARGSESSIDVYDSAHDSAHDSAQDSLWWRFQALERAAATDLERNIPWLREAWKSFEKDVERERTLAEHESMVLRSNGDEHASSLRLTRFMEESVSRAARLAEEFMRECGTRSGD
jgi:secernin